MYVCVYECVYRYILLVVYTRIHTHTQNFKEGNSDHIKRKTLNSH